MAAPSPRATHSSSTLKDEESVVVPLHECACALPRSLARAPETLHSWPQTLALFQQLSRELQLMREKSADGFLRHVVVRAPPTPT